jgi:hypothetical protein
VHGHWQNTEWNSDHKLLPRTKAQLRTLVLVADPCPCMRRLAIKLLLNVHRRSLALHAGTKVPLAAAAHSPIPFIQVGWGGRVKCRPNRWLVHLFVSIVRYVEKNGSGALANFPRGSGAAPTLDCLTSSLGLAGEQRQQRGQHAQICT